MGQTAAKTWKKGERKEKQIILMCKQKYTLPPHAPKEASPLAPPDAPGQRESVCRKERASKVRVRMERNEKVEVKQALTTPARPTYKRNHNKVKRGVVPVPKKPVAKPKPVVKKKPVAKKKPAKKKPSKKSTKLEHPL